MHTPLTQNRLDKELQDLPIMCVFSDTNLLDLIELSAACSTKLNYGSVPRYIKRACVALGTQAWTNQRKHIVLDRSITIRRHAAQTPSHSHAAQTPFHGRKFEHRASCSVVVAIVFRCFPRCHVMFCSLIVCSFRLAST